MKVGVKNRHISYVLQDDTALVAPLHLAAQMSPDFDPDCTIVAAGCVLVEQQSTDVAL